MSLGGRWTGASNDLRLGSERSSCSFRRVSKGDLVLYIGELLFTCSDVIFNPKERRRPVRVSSCEESLLSSLRVHIRCLIAERSQVAFYDPLARMELSCRLPSFKFSGSVV